MSGKLSTTTYGILGVVISLVGVFLVFSAMRDVLSQRQTLVLILGVLLLDVGPSMVGQLWQKTRQQSVGAA